MNNPFEVEVGPLNPFGVHEEDGWIGSFTRRQDVNAIPNGTLIVKSWCEVGDVTPLGSKGVVLGSFSHADVARGEVFYFVEWEIRPKVAVGILGRKVSEAKS